MKLQELLTEQQLNEFNVRKAMATGALAAATALTPANYQAPVANDHNMIATTAAQNNAMATLERQKGINQLAQMAMNKYKGLTPDAAREIAALATKYAKPTFPSAADILSIVGIESSFRSDAVSGLRKDPARGLMQVRPKTWGLNIDDLKGVENQIKVGANILHKYYTRVGDVDSAVHAYNVGMKNFLNKTGLNPKYVTRFNDERKMYNVPSAK